MAYFGADKDELQDVAMRLHAIERDIDSITTGVRAIAADVSRNPSLNKLGYSRMIRAASDSTEKHAKRTGEFSTKLERVAYLYDTYENRVITAPFDEVHTGASAGGERERKASENPFWSFLTGDAKLEGAVLAGELKGEGSFLGIAASGAIGGELLGGELSLKPDVALDLAKGDYHAGVKGKAEGHVAQGTLEGDYGLLHGDLKGSLVTGAVEGELEASLFRNGYFDPSLGGKASAKVSAASGEANARFGAEDTNVHAKAEGDLFTAHAEASAHAGLNGVGAKVEAGAYCAEGEISAGFNLFGVKVDIGLEGKAGGAGAKAAFGVDKDAVSGELALGLLLGAGVNFKIDYSGVPKAIENTVQWWNNLWK